MVFCASFCRSLLESRIRTIGASAARWAAHGQGGGQHTGRDYTDVPHAPSSPGSPFLRGFYALFFLFVTLLVRFRLRFLCLVPPFWTDVFCLHALDRRFTDQTLLCTVRHPPCLTCICSFVRCAGVLHRNPLPTIPPSRPPISAPMFSDVCVANMRLGSAPHRA